MGNPSGKKVPRLSFGGTYFWRNGGKRKMKKSSHP